MFWSSQVPPRCALNANAFKFRQSSYHDSCCVGQNVRGQLSRKIGLFRYVTFLDFSNNQMTGALPEEVFQLPRLRKFIVVKFCQFLATHYAP